MQNPLTRWAVFEDCVRLARHDGEVEPLFLEVARAEPEYARLGAVVEEVEDSFAPAVLRQIRDLWAVEDEHPDLDCKLAFCIGALTRAASDLTIRPLVERVVLEDQSTVVPVPDARREILAYQDAHVFRRAFLEGYEEDFGDFLASNGYAPGEEAAGEFARALFMRALLASHTLIPDMVDVNRWIDNLFASADRLDAEIDRLVAAFVDPRPAKVEHYRIEPAFYAPQDPAIDAARALWRGEKVGADAVRAALETGANESAYGRAVELGVEYLRRAGAFWRGEVKGFSAPDYSTPKRRERALAVGTGEVG
jgi:hypothetical protein